MTQRVCLVGLDEPEVEQIRERLGDGAVVIAHEALPRIVVRDGQLLVESRRGPNFVAVDKLVFHSIYADDFDFLCGVALWGGPCLPNARAMMDCRLKLPCLVRALEYTQFPMAARGYAAPHTPYGTDRERVAKWGNWHCGENKARFGDFWQSEQACLIEDYIPGQAVRVVLIGEQAWQIRLEGQGWLKSIHDIRADFMPLDPDLLRDTRRVQQGFGLEVVANDYIISTDGQPYLLEVNHIPNVTRFPALWQAYREYAVSWINNTQAAEDTHTAGTKPI